MCPQVCGPGTLIRRLERGSHLAGSSKNGVMTLWCGVPDWRTFWHLRRLGRVCLCALLRDALGLPFVPLMSWNGCDAM